MVFFMLVKFDGEKESFYLCTCSDWTTVVLSDSIESAARDSVKLMFDETGKDFNVSAVVRVKKIEEELENLDSLVRMDEILSDLGMYNESKALREIFNK